ncbi:hypothetical protein AAF712_016206, partial [Marasmius tenuissimus]
MYLSHSDTSIKKYNDSIQAIQDKYPAQSKNEILLSFYCINKLVCNITGVEAVETDMCLSTCIGYSGPYELLKECLFCAAPQEDPIEKHPQTFKTMLLAFVMQALHRDPMIAKEMLYLQDRMPKLLEEYEEHGYITEIDHIACREDVEDVFWDGKIQADDTVIMMSLNGCQLYKNKTSDCWMYGFVLVNLFPDKRYKKKYFIPSSIFPGPNNLKVMESFLYIGLRHISVVANAGGLRLWDAYQDKMIKSRIFILFSFADCSGMVYWNGLVGHTGKVGCCFWCPLVGRRKPKQHTYYPILFKLTWLAVPGSSHPDQDPHEIAITPIDPTQYMNVLRTVCGLRTKQAYKINCQDYGVPKPSILLGLPPGITL